MSLRTLVERLSAVFHKEKLDHELDEDIREHLHMATDVYLRRGMNPTEAAEAARRSFGGREQMKEEFRDQRGIPAFETFTRELRLTARSLARTPGFTSLAVITLAAGIGVNSAIFSAINVLLLTPAGVSDPSRLVVIRGRYDKLNIKNSVISLADFKDVRESREIFSAAAIAQSGDYNYAGGAYPQRLVGQRVTWQWFDVFGVQPALGRTFSPEEDQPDNNQVALLSNNAWRGLFGGDPTVVGKTIELNQLPYRIVGVLGPSQDVGIDALDGGVSAKSPDLFVPLGARDTIRNRFNESYLGVARLQGGVSPARAQAYMGVLTERGFQAPFVGVSRKDNGRGLYIISFADFVSGQLKTPLFILWGAVGFVLLIACANIAGLMVARVSARAREQAVRLALGGTRWHLVRQMLSESMMLALGGSLLGLGVAYTLIRGIAIFGPESVVGGIHIPFDFRVLLFTSVAGMVSAVLAGIAPASQLWRDRPGEALKESGRSGTASRGRLRLRFVLVTAEVALALVLSVGAGLFLRSLSQIQGIDPGFQGRQVMTSL